MRHAQPRRHCSPSVELLRFILAGCGAHRAAAFLGPLIAPGLPLWCTTLSTCMNKKSPVAHEQACSAVGVWADPASMPGAWLLLRLLEFCFHGDIQKHPCTDEYKKQITGLD